MKMLRRFLLCSMLAAFTAMPGLAQEATSAAAEQQANTNAAAAATVAKKVPPAPDFLEHLVDATLEIFDVRSHENTVTHFVIAAVFLVASAH